MNVLLVNPSYGIQAYPATVSLGLLSIASFLKERGVHVRLYDRNVEKTSLEKVMQAFAPDAVGVSVITMVHIDDAAAVSRRVRARGIPVVWGGHMASIVPEMVLREGCADYVAVGEGEITFYELLQAIEAKRGIEQVNGIVCLDAAGHVQRTPERAFANLVDFSVIDWSFIDPENYFASHFCCKKMIHLYGSKGCPERCAFCFNEGFHHCKYRRRPNEYVIREIQALAAEHDFDGVYFIDESFGMHKGEMYDLCDRLRALNLGIVWGCQTRLGHLTLEDLQYMYDSGLRWMFFGVESGSPEMIERIHKKIDLTKIDREFRECKEIGISATCGIIIGYPDETEEQLRQTVQLMLRLDTALFQISTFIPIPGSELYNELVENGRLAPFQTLREWSGYGAATIHGVVANYSNVPTRDLHVIQGFFQWQRFFSTNGIAKNTKAYKVVLASIRSEGKRGFLYMCRDVLVSAKIFLTVVWYTFAYPGVRKKYGLTLLRNRKRRA